MPKFDLKNLHSIRGVEIFREGVWNGSKFSKEDLEQIVASYRETRDAIKPFLKLGHNDEQEVLKRDDIPAAGWVSDMRLENRGEKGHVIVADFQGIPSKIYTLIENGVFRGRSIEIWRDLKVAGKTHRWLLTAVAILGADLPAVDSLEDMLNLFSANGETVEGGTVHKFEAEGERLVFQTEDTNQQEEDQMPKEEELTKALGVKEAEVTELSKKLSKEAEEKKIAIAERDDYKARFEKAEAEKVAAEKARNEAAEEAAKFKAEKIEAQIDKELDDMIRAKKVNPAQKEPLKAIFKASASGKDGMKFSFGDKKDLSLKEAVLAFVSAGSAGLSDKERGSAGDHENPGEKKVGNGLAARQEKLRDAAKDYQKKMKAEGKEVSYKEALCKVGDAVENDGDEDEEDDAE